MVPLHFERRELHFVAVDGHKSRNDASKKERSSVRAFVMRDYLRQKNDPTWKFTPAKVDDSMTSHISRFRSIKTSSTGRTKKRKTATTRNRRLEEKPRSQRPLVPAPSVSDDQSVTHSSPHDLEGFDPFGTLEVDLSDPDSQSLLQYYTTAFWANSYACNPEARWISVALMDPAIIHATLSLVAIHRRDCFSIDLSKIYFKHRGEAMKIVARRLGNLDESLSDETIGAVALLSSSDNHFDWPSDTQSTHSQALGRLVAMRGGMKSLDTNRHIQRVAGWADLLQSAIHGTSLQVEVPAAVQEASTDDVDPSTIGDQAEPLPLGILLQELPQTVGDMLRRLRILSSLKVSLLEERNPELCQTFSNLLWKLEHSILRNSTHDSSESQSQHFFKDDMMAHVVGIATLIFSYLTLRDLAAPILYTRLSNRLQSHFTELRLYLEQLGDEAMNEAELSTLLWSLFFGWRGSRKNPKIQALFTNQLAELCWRHGILSYDSIKTRIQSVIPQARDLVDISEDFWVSIEEVIWSDMISFDDDLSFVSL